mgnify:CR=1 FL=1
MGRRLCWQEIYKERRGTIAQKIAMVIQDGDYVTAGIWVSVVVLIAFVIIFSYEFHFRTKDEKYREVVKDGD